MAENSILDFSRIILSMKLINSENNKISHFPTNPQSSCAIILINLKGPCIYLLMGSNDYFGPLVNVEGATSISTILLVDVDVGSFSLYKYVPTPWVKYTKTIVREPLVWEIPRVVN